MKKVLILSWLFVCVASHTVIWAMQLTQQSAAQVQSAKYDISWAEHFLQCDVSSLQKRVQFCLDQVTKQLADSIAIPVDKKNYDNTLRVIDDAMEQVANINSLAHVLVVLSPDEAMRGVAQEATKKTDNYIIDYFEQNVQLFDAIAAYCEHGFVTEASVLTSEQRAWKDELLKRRRRFGLHLSESVRNELGDLKKRIAELVIQFDDNISSEKKTIEVDRAALAGLDEQLIAGLPRNGNTYLVGVDRPTYFAVIDHCSIAKTRELLWLAYMNRGYPANEAILQEIRTLRQRVASLLGYQSYADFELDNTMAQRVDRVESFLQEIEARAMPKVLHEVTQLKQSLVQGVTLTPDGKIQPWDLRYLRTAYKKEQFDLDERQLAEYFPLEQTIERLLAIYEEFFSLKFVKVRIAGLWHEEVRALAVYDQQKQIRGYILMDLQPRPNKYTHTCSEAMVRSRKQKNGIQPAIILIIANFPRSSAQCPALLMRHDVIDFFHELGHALHGILGTTELFNFSGTMVKRDFVELPSQMLEEWMWDAKILQRVSCHYQTEKPLDTATIEHIKALRKFDSGDFLSRQITYAKFSLSTFKHNLDCDLLSIKHALSNELQGYIVQCPDEHFECSFTHLMNYGSKYYGYLWSQVFALDLFAFIRGFGLCNPEIGARYVQTILSKGGSVDPNQLLRDFLGREPQSAVFFDTLFE